MKPLSLLTLLFAVLCSAKAAAGLIWVLEGAVFNDTGTGGLSGSYEFEYVFDADEGEFVAVFDNINITASGTGGGGGDGLYVQLLGKGGQLGLDASKGPEDLNNGDTFISLFLQSVMTDAGGTIIIEELTLEKVIDDIGTTTVLASGSFSGTVTSVPEPSALVMLGLGLALSARRRRAGCR